MTCKDCLHYEACLAANATFRLQLDFERGATCCYSFVPASDWKKVERGKWIQVKCETGVEAFGFKEMTVQAFECSHCQKEVDVSENYFKYCPNCGAKMDLEDEK